MIKFNDINKINAAYKNIFLNSFNDFLTNEKYILGSNVEAFENEFAAYCGTKYCIGTGNGYDAIFLSLKVLDLKPGSEVIVAANTHVAGFLAILNLNLVPVVVDVNTNTFLPDENIIVTAITKNTKAILLVHLYGQIVYSENLKNICATNNIILIEDAAQCHGAVISNKKSGGLGDIAAFSFYPTKNLGALGDAGCIVTNDKTYYEQLKALRNYGWTKKNHLKYIGCNSRLDEIQAMFLRVKLKKLDEINAKRQEIAQRFLNEIKNNKIFLPKYSLHHVWHLFVIRCEQRKALIDYLNHNQIETAIHYPIPSILQPAISTKINFAAIPVTKKLSETILSIPLNESLTESEIRKIIFTLNNFN